MGRLFGTQYQNAALRAVPPSSGAFSSRITSSPSQRAKSAAGRPPPPPPTPPTPAARAAAPPPTPPWAVRPAAPAPTGAADARSIIAHLQPVPARRAGFPLLARAAPRGP